MLNILLANQHRNNVIFLRLLLIGHASSFQAPPSKVHAGKLSASSQHHVRNVKQIQTAFFFNIDILYAHLHCCQQLAHALDFLFPMFTREIVSYD